MTKNALGETKFYVHTQKLPRRSSCRRGLHGRRSKLCIMKDNLLRCIECEFLLYCSPGRKRSGLPGSKYVQYIYQSSTLALFSTSNLSFYRISIYSITRSSSSPRPNPAPYLSHSKTFLGASTYLPHPHSTISSLNCSS